MYIYRVLCTMTPDTAVKWEDFFLRKHLQDLMDTGCFTGYSFRKIQNDMASVQFVTEYHVASQADLDRYNNQYATALKAEVQALFKGQFVCTRQVEEVVQAG